MNRGEKMPRPKIVEQKRTFATPVSADVIEDFKVKCKENNMPMNVVIETFMRQYAAGEFEIKFVKGNTKYLDSIKD